MPEVRTSETTMADDDSHHCRRSLSRQFSRNSPALPVLETNIFIADVSSPYSLPVRNYFPSQRSNDKVFVLRRVRLVIVRMEQCGPIVLTATLVYLPQVFLRPS